MYCTRGAATHARSSPRVLALIVAGRFDPALGTRAVVRFDEPEVALVDAPTKLIPAA